MPPSPTPTPSSSITLQGDIGRAFPAHLCHSEDEVHGRVLRVSAFQLHAPFEAILAMGDCLRLSMHRAERTRLPPGLILA